MGHEAVGFLAVTGNWKGGNGEGTPELQEVRGVKGRYATGGRGGDRGWR